MDWYDAPCTLYAELFEEGCSDDLMAAGEGIWIEQGTTNDGDEDDGEATAENLGRVADDCTACHSA